MLFSEHSKNNNNKHHYYRIPFEEHICDLQLGTKYRERYLISFFFFFNQMWKKIPGLIYTFNLGLDILFLEESSFPLLFISALLAVKIVWFLTNGFLCKETEYINLNNVNSPNDRHIHFSTNIQ